MNYTTIEINNTEYKLRLDIRALIDAQKKLKKSPLSVIMINDPIELYEKIEDIITIFYFALKKYQPSITIKETEKIFDDYIDNENSIDNLVIVLTDIFVCSGLIPREKQEEKTEKN